MNIVVDCYHPANFLILKNPMKQLASEGHNIFWCIRAKDVLEDLLKGEKLPYALLSKPKQGNIGRAIELVEHDYKVFREIIKRKARLAIGASISVAHAAFLVPGTESIVFNDDDANVVKPFVKLGYPFADWIVTPECLQEDHGARHVKHNSYHVLSYLHPDHFSPEQGILDELGIEPEQKLFLLRFVSLQAFHDTHAVGLSFEKKLQVINYLKKRGRVLISCEGQYPQEFESMIFKADPIKMHSIMARCDLVVSDSQTMTAEAAALGVPSVRCNTFVGRISYLEELENKYQLTFGYQPEDFKKAFRRIEFLVNDKNTNKTWQERRKKMLNEKENLADWIYNFIKSRYLPK